MLFLGKEVEGTLIFGEDTLFVAGVEPADKVLATAKTQGVGHVFLGAHNSFSSSESAEWNALATSLLEAGLRVTLDFPFGLIDTILSMSCASHPRFFPLLSITVDQARALGENLSIKINSTEGGGGNGGVWCSPIRWMQFTPWRAYKDDIMLEPTSC